MHKTPDKPVSPHAVETGLSRFRAQMRAYRNKQGLTQAVAAGNARISQEQWSRYESGKAAPSLEAILGIQYALGVQTLEDFFGKAPTDQLLH